MKARNCKFFLIFLLILLPTCALAGGAEDYLVEGEDPDVVKMDMDFELIQEEQDILKEMKKVGKSQARKIAQRKEAGEAPTDYSASLYTSSARASVIRLQKESEIDLGIAKRVRQNYVAPELPAARVMASYAPVRMGPGNSYNWIYVAREGEELMVERVRGEWTRAVTRQGVKGWFPTSAVSFF